MTPAAAIAMLDRMLAKDGEPVVLRRYTGPNTAPLSTFVDTPVIAKVNPLTPEEIASGLDQRKRNLILSPTHVGAGPVAGARDAVMFGTEKYIVSRWFERRIGATVVRIEAQVG